MGNPGNALKEVTKIGNYAIPTFGAVLTALLCISSFQQSAPEGQAIVINFALYTLMAAFASYIHRISYLRYRETQTERGEKATNLPFSAVLMLLLIHLMLIGILFYNFWPLTIIETKVSGNYKFIFDMNEIAVLVIGLLGVYIAWRQWSTAAYRFRLDLFEKRFVIYESIIDFILSIRGGGKVLDEHMAIFKEKTLPTRFLFDDKVADYISEIKEKAYDAQTFMAESEGMPPGDERAAILRKASEAKKWLYKQIQEREINNKLGSYLRVTPSSLGIMK